jgi:hypothetical protein
MTAFAIRLTHRLPFPDRNRFNNRLYSQRVIAAGDILSFSPYLPI